MIRLTNKHTGKPLLLNPEFIVSIGESTEDTTVYVTFSEKLFFEVGESLDEIERLLAAWGKNERWLISKTMYNTPISDFVIELDDDK